MKRRNLRQTAHRDQEPPAQTALEVLGDLYRTLGDGTAAALLAGISGAKTDRRATLDSLRNPWDS